MSTILKALRRLEQEKSTRSDRPLGEAVAGAAPVPAPQTARSRRWPIFAAIAIGVIVLGVAAFAATQWSRGVAESAPGPVAAVPVEPEAPAVPGRRFAASDPAKAKKPAANRRPVRAQKSRKGPNTAGEPPTETAIPDVAVVARSQPASTSRLGTRLTPAAAASAASSGSTGAQPPGVSPATPSSRRSPLIDLSQLEELQAAAKLAGKSRESFGSARVAPTSSGSAPTSQPKPAPVEVAVARPAPEPVPTPVPSTVPKSEPTPVPSTAKKPEPTPRSEPSPEPKTEPKPEPQSPRQVARKSPSRPSAPPPPKVYVSRTVWHPVASRRIAYLEFEGRGEIVALREGESIGPLLVTEISPTEVSFDNRGSELKRRVGAR